MTKAIKQSTFFLTDFGRYSAGGENISTPACVPAFPLRTLTAQATAQQGERAGKVQLNYNQGFQLPEPRGASVLTSSKQNMCWSLFLSHVSFNSHFEDGDSGHLTRWSGSRDKCSQVLDQHVPYRNLNCILNGAADNSV